MEANNWLALLKWSLSQSNDGTNISEYTEMSVENKTWLEDVMKGLVKDETSRMNEIFHDFLKIIDFHSTTTNNTTNTDQITNNNLSNNLNISVDNDLMQDQLDELRDMIEQIDMAQIFARFGGLQCLLNLLELNNDIINIDSKCCIASTIGTLLQNNLIVQDKAYSIGALDKITKVFISTSNYNLCNKILYAISCMIRNHAALEEYFILHCIDNILSYILQCDYDPMISRILFLCHALITSDTCTNIRLNKLLNLLLPSCLIYITNNDNIDLRENTIQLCNTILHTSLGHELLHITYHNHLLDIISTREKYLINHIIDNNNNNNNNNSNNNTTIKSNNNIFNKDMNSIGYTKDEVSHEINLLKKLRQLSNLEISIVKYPKKSNISINNQETVFHHSNNNINTIAATTSNISNTLLPVLSNQSINPDDIINNNTQQVMLLPSSLT